MHQIQEILAFVYPKSDSATLLNKLQEIISEFKNERPSHLKKYEKNLDKLWYKNRDNIMYILYADLFCADEPEGEKIKGITKRLNYFQELGITNLHILPILKTSGDGGFAVDDYRQIDPRFGNMEELEKLCEKAHEIGIKITLDLVLNHVSDTHEWANEYKSGSKKYRDYFIIDETGTGQLWGDGVADVFPDFAPGRWDYVPETKEYVWATFYAKYPTGPSKKYNDFSQWDLNYKNPEVLFSMIENMLYLANRGVDVFRFDAIPHMWKEQGTSCFALPQNLKIVKIFRYALEELAPKSAILNETNGKYSEIVDFFSEGDSNQLSYNFVLPHRLLLAVVTGDIKPLIKAVETLPKIPSNCEWVVFDVNHDETTFGKLGDNEDGKIAETLLKEFTAPKAIPFGYDSTKDKHPHGVVAMMWSLFGGDLAESEKEKEQVIRKIMLMNVFKLFFGGIPQFYQGEELGLSNDYSYEKDSVKKKDGRFAKRLKISDKDRESRHLENSKQNRIFSELRKLIAIRKELASTDKVALTLIGTNSEIREFYGDDKSQIRLVLNFSDKPTYYRTQGKCKDPISGDSYVGQEVLVESKHFKMLLREKGKLLP